MSDPSSCSTNVVMEQAYFDETSILGSTLSNQMNMASMSTPPMNSTSTHSPHCNSDIFHNIELTSVLGGSEGSGIRTNGTFEVIWDKELI